MKDQRVGNVIRNWCGQRPARGSETLQGLWETHGPSGVPFDDEGAERLIRALGREFPGHGLRSVDVLGLTVDGVIEAIPDSALEPAVAFTLAARKPAPIPETIVPPVVSLSEQTIELLATRIAQLLAAARPAQAARRPRPKAVRRPAKGVSKSGRRKDR